MATWQIDQVHSRIERTDLADQIYSIVREAILKRQLKPGDKISVQELTATLGVSRNPVIVALQHLANERLVEIIPQRGTFVTELTVRDVSEIFEMRLMIELYAAGRLFETGQVAQFLEAVRDPVARMERAIVKDNYGDYETFINADHDLHLTLVKYTVNQHLVHTFSELNVHVQVARAHYIECVETAREAFTEHEAILLALRDDDSQAVEQAIRHHIGNARDRILAILQKQERQPQVERREYNTH